MMTFAFFRCFVIFCDVAHIGDGINEYQRNVVKPLNIRQNKSQNINVARLVLQLALPNPWKPGVKYEAIVAPTTSE